MARLKDILDAINKIEKYSSQGNEEFEGNELIQIWIIHHLQIIGEAARTISGSFQKANPKIPWNQIVAMRNILVHDYLGIKLSEVWAVAKNDLPELKKYIKEIL